MLYGERIKQIKKDCFQRPLKIKECRECPWRNYCGGGCMGNAFEATGTIWNPESCNVRKEWIRKSFEAMVSEIPFEANFKEPETR